MSFTWKVSPQQAFGDGFRRYQENILNRLEQRCQDRADEIEAWMQANAPWTDRTGTARAMLTAEVNRQGDMVWLSIISGAEYGLYLEVCNQGRWGIVGPALDEFGPQIMADARSIVGAR